MPGRREEMPFFLDDGEFRSSDLGLRVVLSGIVTPQNRSKALREQWTKISERKRLANVDHEAPKSAVDDVRGKILVAEIERRAAATNDDSEKEMLLSEADYIKRLANIVGDQQSNSIETLIWKTLFSIESLHKYILQRNQLENELEMLKKMKSEPLPESEIESLNKNISSITEQISHSNTAIEYLAQSYLANIRNSQKFSPEAIDRLLDSTFQNQILEESLRSSLNSRLELFREHLSDYTSNPESIQPEKIIQDIISEIVP